MITVCNKAQELCPTFPGKVKRIHWSFEDPVEAIGTKEEKMRVFRKVRDKIKEHIIFFIKEIETKSRMENASGN